MTDSSIIFYPVLNGDTSLIRVGDGKSLTNILVDCQICDDGIFDVHTDLLEKLTFTAGAPHLDVFILTHPHKDHIAGFQEHFYVGDPKDYSDKDKKKGLILVDELWFAPKIFNTAKEDLPEDGKVFRKEAERRIELYRSGKAIRSEPGNRLRIIGASDNDDLADLKEITTWPGQIVNLFNGKLIKTFHCFIYAPVKKDSDNDDLGPNNTSIAFEARFDVDGVENAVKVFFGGDAECPVLERIVSVNEDEDLEYDLFHATHHCSWTALSTEPCDDENKPSQKVMHWLSLKRGKAYIIASCKPIIDDDDNPPHYRAKLVYEGVVGKKNFLCTSEYPNTKNPQPICFTMTSNGVVKSDPSDSKNKATESILYTTASTPRRYG